MAYEGELKQAIATIRAGDRKAGSEILHQILLKDRNHEQAWLWMAACVDKPDDKVYCLNEVLRVNPENESAKKALAKFREQTAPAIEEIVQFPTVQPLTTPQVSSGSVSTIIVILLVILGLFWLGVAFTQLGLGASGATGNQSDDMSMLLCGAWNIMISIVNLVQIGDVLKRYHRVVQNLTLLGILGSIWGVIQLFSGSWPQTCAIPLYITLAVLAQINKAYFSELTPKEKQQNEKATAALQKQ